MDDFNQDGYTPHDILNTIDTAIALQDPTGKATDVMPMHGAGMELQAQPAFETMSEEDLKALVTEKLQDSHQWWGADKTGRIRIEADKFYRGEPLGNEEDGRSSVVSRDVAETVDDSLPSFMRIFAGSEEICVFTPFSKEDEEASKQATDYVNHIFLQENDGFIILHNWFKDALLKKNGIIKIIYEVRNKRNRESYKGLTDIQLQLLQMDQSIRVEKVEPYQEQIIQQDFATMQPVSTEVTLYNCTTSSAKPVKRIVIANVPPDEFVIERRAVSIETACFMAHRAQRTISDLIECGFDADKLYDLPKDSNFERTVERTERFTEENQHLENSSNAYDKSMRKVSVVEAYIKCDYDGDGVAEWRKVTLAGYAGGTGSIVLENIETEGHPFAVLTPVPEPHKFHGRSLFDQTKDLQEIKSALLRGILDSTYLANTPRMGVVDGQVNLDDLLNPVIGGIVRMKSIGALQPIASTMVSGDAMQVMRYIDEIKERRTGLSAGSAGLSDNILNSSATGADILNNKSQQRLELIARIFAETGVKQLFRRILQLVCEYQDVPRVIRLRNKWVNVNPRDWKDKMDAVATIGLGMGSKQQQVNTTMQMLQLDEKIVQLQGGLNGPFLKPENIYAKLSKLVEGVGWKSVDPYYLNPADKESQPPPLEPKQPSPEQQLAAEVVKAEAQKAQTETDRKQMELLATVEMKKIDFQIKQLELEMKKLEYAAVAQASPQLRPTLAGFVDND